MTVSAWAVVLLLPLLGANLAATGSTANNNNNQQQQQTHGKKVVVTPFGVVRGETVHPPADDLPAVTQYLGIPFGISTGQYRFDMAISAAKWTHQPKDAFRFSPVCVQSGLAEMSEAEALNQTSSQRFDRLHKLFPHLTPASEDCLFMNIFVPERMDNRAAGGENKQLSVLVVVHGSEYGWGTGNGFNATVLSSFGSLIVVTLNYRLGIYGFLGRCESNSCTGNAGLSDLVAALKMLSNILPSFGGDPSSLTLIGWGSGASLISLLMISPITQPKNRLFRRAILLDGTALSPWALVDHSQEYFFKAARELQCTNDGKMDFKNRNIEDASQQVSQIVRCIQEHSQANLTKAARKIHAPSFMSAFAPIVDGQIVPNHPRISFSPKFGALFRDIDLLVGTVTYPAHHLIANADLLHGIDLEKRDKVLRTLVRNLFDYHRQEIFGAILNEYTDWDNPKNHPKTVRNNLLNTLGDVLYTTPLIETARMHSTDEVPNTSNTFLFHFAHETRVWTRDHQNSGIRGSLSDDHVPYILGYPLANRDRENQIYEGFSNDDKGISRVLMRYISNFVKTGDPAKPQPISTETTIEDRFHGTPWPQFNQATREAYLEITDRPRVKNYYRNSYVGFWTSFVPQLNKGSKTVPEEHNFLQDHLNKNSFYGTVRPYFSYHNDPFPPPPMPPSPPPTAAIKKPSPSPSAAAASQSDQPAQVSDLKVLAETKKSESLGLAITVAVGVGFLVLNLILYVSIVAKCFEKKRKAKQQLKYQSYTTGHPPGSDDPLLNSNSKSSTPGLRPGISPTCPRHGRAAQMIIAASRANSIGSAYTMGTVGAGGQTLEEVQV